MSSILHTLRESDPAMLPLLAQLWSVRIEGLDTPGAIDAVSKAMLEPGRAESIWDALGDKERGALQMLITGGAKMHEPKFAMLYGKIRRLSAKEIAREKPIQNPQSVAEALFFRGLIALGYETDATGPKTIVYVPDDLVQVLPTRKTSYDNLEDEEFEDIEEASDETGDTLAELDPLAKEDVINPHAADTSIIDDLTTLLAYLQIHAPTLERDFFRKKDLDGITAHLLNPDRARLVFMLGIGISANLIEVQNGRASTNRVELRRWLNGTRAEQIKHLANAWKNGTVWIDLFHVPGLHPEPEAGTLNQYNPAAVREAILDMMSSTLPQSDWWSIDQLIDIVREESADFQRPNGDFDSWYIRNDDGDYLSGIESWDAVEGALLDFMITRPLHWLGMLDLADGAARLTAYGRGLLSLTPFPMPPETPDALTIGADGGIVVSRKASRMDRFQVCRFSSWVAPADLTGKPYTYKLDPAGITRAQAQGIDSGHIGAFLSKFLNPLPPTIARLLQNWQGGAAASVTFERVMIMRATSVEVMEQIVNTPATRRFLGARLGDLAAIIRADQWEMLQDALGEMGIQVEVNG